MMESGYHANSLVLQCLAFELTHDVGNQVLNWMYSLPVAKLPPVSEIPRTRDDFIGSHWVGREDRTEHLKNFNPNKDSVTFYATHQKWMGHSIPNMEQVNVNNNEELRWYKNVTGFNQTRTYALHGDPRTWGEGQWFTMTHSDCMNKG
jgi:hypothetical protein